MSTDTLNRDDVVVVTGDTRGFGHTIPPGTLTVVRNIRNEAVCIAWKSGVMWAGLADVLRAVLDVDGAPVYPGVLVEVVDTPWRIFRVAEVDPEPDFYGEPVVRLEEGKGRTYLPARHLRVTCSRLCKPKDERVVHRSEIEGTWRE